ncbi:hypothetical protein LTR08_001969 [Meristemomyces frigidus]|nr:hypothetical protein LTR08_001969 [Meristemomyces frigidus]
MSTASGPPWSRNSSVSTLGSIAPSIVGYYSHAATHPTLRHGSDASVTAGATRGDTSIYPLAHDSPRLSYQSLTSEYSTITTAAIDRVPRTTSASAPPVPPLPTFAQHKQRIGQSPFPPRSSSKAPVPTRAYEANLTVPGTPMTAAWSQNLTQDLGAITGAVSQPTAALTASDSHKSFEVAPQQTHCNPHHQEATARLSGQVSEQYSPPHWLSSAVLALPERNRGPKARHDAHNAAIVANPTAQLAATAANPVPYALNSRPPPRPPGRNGTLTKTLGRGIAKVTNFARRRSSASRPAAGPAPVRGALVPPGNVPLGGPPIVNTIPIREAQRLRARPGITMQDFSPRPQHAKVVPQVQAPAAPTSPVVFPQVQAPAAPTNPVAQAPAAHIGPVARPLQAGPRKVRVVGNANRVTQFGDFIDLSDSNSDSSAVAQPGDTADILATRPVPDRSEADSDRGSGHTSDILIIRPLPAPEPEAWIKRKPMPAPEIRRKPVPTSQPAKTPVQGRLPPDLDKPLPPTPHPHQTPEEAAAITHVLGVNRGRDFNDLSALHAQLRSGDSDSDRDSDRFSNASQEYGNMPEYADEIYGDPQGIIPQVDGMDLDLQQKMEIATEAGRLQRLFTRPPAGATGGDENPTTVIDTTHHASHTTWVVTDTSQLNVISSVTQRIPNIVHLQPEMPEPQSAARKEPDAAGVLMARLDRERYGMGP